MTEKELTSPSYVCISTKKCPWITCTLISIKPQLTGVHNRLQLHRTPPCLESRDEKLFSCGQDESEMHVCHAGAPLAPCRWF